MNIKHELAASKVHYVMQLPPLRLIGVVGGFYYSKKINNHYDINRTSCPLLFRYRALYSSRAEAPSESMGQSALEADPPSFVLYYYLH
jgi:hypothetical protein